MDPHLHLLIHEAVTAISAIVAIVLSVFIITAKERKVVHVTTALTCLASAVFEISHLVGTSVADSELSRQALMWNLIVIVISAFNFHSAMAALGRDKEKRGMIALVYGISAAFIGFYLAFPSTFLLESVPKMYFPNYYVPGQYYWVSRAVFQILLPMYFVYELVRGYKRAENPLEKNRVMYYMTAFALAWGLGIIPPLLIFNIQVDPLYGIYFPIPFAILFTYAVMKYEILDIKVIAKRAVLYGLSVAAVGGVFSFLILLSQYLEKRYAGFPTWLLPLLSSIMAVSVAVFVWRRMREADLLKYEFITTVTHKFRTPLTHIKWAAGNLRSGEAAEDKESQFDIIDESSAKLVELTNLLITASQADDVSFGYKADKVNVSEVAEEIQRYMSRQAKLAGVALLGDIDRDVFIKGDASRIKFVVQALVDNAIHYTMKDGSVLISLKKSDDGYSCVLSVKDNGIGISKEALHRVFSKFYRGDKARHIDTEGLGIGLFISKGIIEKHGGKIWAKSEGEDKGSEFGFSLPIFKA